MTNFNEQITRNFMQLCYHCDDAHRCDTEQKCMQCWEEQGLLHEDEALNETQQFLQMMHA